LKPFTRFLNLDEDETKAFIYYVDRIVIELINPNIPGDIQVIINKLQEIHDQKNMELEGMVDFESERSRESIQQLQGIDRRIDYYQNQLKQSNENETVSYTFLSTLGSIFGGKKNTKRRKTRKNKTRKSYNKK